LNESDVMYEGWLTIRAVPDGAGRLPAKEWFDQLSQRDRARARAGMENYSRSLEAGLRCTGRTEVIRTKGTTFLELRLTRGGSRGPQLRLLGVLKGRTFWAAHGFTKKSRKINPKDITAAVIALESWRPPDDDSPPSTTTGRP
jgi:hypothetical protein